MQVRRALLSGSTWGSDCLGHLHKGTHLDLADPLPTNAEGLRQPLECGRLVLEPPFDEDMTLARIEPFDGSADQFAARAELLLLPQSTPLVVSLIGKPVLPLPVAI